MDVVLQKEEEFNHVAIQRCLSKQVKKLISSKTDGINFFYVNLQTEKLIKYQQEINDYRRIRLRP
ncbi:hypothetical protein GCM10022291_19900 [Postechiella marina]|uniref:Uncharacterized protein n=1 Tax=Postechiella marina TaxID=943941 RepID=A0ABP8C9L9_9FLAO